MSCLRRLAPLLALMLAPCIHAAAKQEDPRLFASPRVVQDLYYGDVLFYFFQDDYFQALTRLSAAQMQGRVPHHEGEAELLKGGLYLSLGQHEEAGRIFKTLLNENVTDSVRNRAWFYLAKLWYQRNYLKESEFALNSIKGTLPGGYEGERQLLHAQVLMYQDRYDEAIAVLEKLDTHDAWAAYARFNLGVALVRQNRLEDAARMLDSVGQINTASDELQALRDKANLALGFAYLKAGRPADAKVILQRVRLEGSQSNKALLAAGWADAAQQQYKTALVPWTELQKRNLLDAAVQESYLAVPYAYAQLSANKQAADQYEKAIAAFEAESSRIDESIAAIREGKLVDTILEHDKEAQGADHKPGTDDAGWYWQLKNLPDEPQTRYLYHLLATHEFQEGLKNYRDLGIMNRNLDGWRENVVAFEDMIDTRRRAYDQRMPLLKAALDDVDLNAMDAHFADQQARLTAIERDNDVAGLATPKEAERWQLIQQIQTELDHADPTDPDVKDQLEKARLIRGVLYWDLNANYKARLWGEHKQTRDLEVALKDARRRAVLLERARNESPKRTEEFAERVKLLQPKIDALAERLASVRQRQNQYLSGIAIAELESQKQRLAAYELQAQFALASIYDRASTGTPAATPPAGGTP